MLNLKAIEALLLPKKLATGMLFSPIEECRCAMGEILHTCGVPDETLREIDDSPEMKPGEYNQKLLDLGGSCIRDTFGITSPQEVALIIQSNDDNNGESEEVIEQLSQWVEDRAR